MANPRNLVDIAPLVSKSGTNLVLSNSAVLTGGSVNGVVYLDSNKAAVTSNNLTFDGNTLNANNLTVAGNLTVSGTTTTINSTTLTLTDPIITLGGSTAPTVDDNKDRGIEFRWHNGTSAKVGFFGFDDSTGYFTFIPDTTNTSEVFSGSVGTLDVASITGSSAKWTTGRTISLTGDVTYTSPSFDGTGDVTAAATLATVNSNVGTYGSGSSIPVITVNSKGLVTAVSTSAVSIPSGQTSGSTTSGYLQYSGTTSTSGQINGGTTTPTGTTRLNYEGYLYSTRLYSTESSTATLKVTGSTSGFVGLAAPAVAGSTTYILPNSDGTSGYVLATDGSGNLSWTTRLGGGISSSRTQVTATAGQTTFNINYTVGQVDVYLNGVKMLIGTDVTCTTGTTVVLATGAKAGDVLEAVTFTPNQQMGTPTDIYFLSGNFGVGTASPQYLLDVNGTARISSDLTVSGTLTATNTIVGSINGNAATVTNGVYTTGSYSDPSWITTLSETKVLPSQTNNGGKYLTTNGSTTSWATVSGVPDYVIQSFGII